MIYAARLTRLTGTYNKMQRDGVLSPFCPPLSALFDFIDPRYEWSILLGPRIQTLPSWLLIGWKKVRVVSCGRIHVTNFKIL